MPDLPTETVTFLFTDIESHSGHVFKTEGDAFYAVCDSRSRPSAAACSAPTWPP